MMFETNPAQSAVSVPKVELRDISKTFSGDVETVRALTGISLSVAAGEFITLIGPSGSGKSTLLNLIVGLSEPDSGEINIDGEKYDRRADKVAYMPQRDLLMPWRTILENVIIPLQLKGIPDAQAHTQATELLPLFGLGGFASALPFHLSGGMRQRAAFLRTILMEREILLLDEPFGALDALTRRELQDWLLELWRRFQQTVIFITHDVEEALYLGDRVIVLSPRPGKIIRTLEVALPRPRRQGMIALPDFGRQVTELLDALGVAI